MSSFRIAVLSGDGIGPEVMDAALKVLARTGEIFDFQCDLAPAYVGGVAIDKCGEALPQETLDICSKSDAILFGSVGGPKWESLPIDKQPERAALLPIRKHFDLYANLRPALVFPFLSEISPLALDRLKAGVDVMIIRELTGGIYFGSPKLIEKDRALDTLVYTRREVERIAHLAFLTARKRRKKLTSIDKANVLSSMVFWREVVSDVAKQYTDVKLNHMYVDNAAMQLIIAPDQFDVMLTPNMFGDILSDEASTLAGSLGMLASASLNEKSFGLYEPAGGTAPDIAGKNIANPIAQILCVAMMLRYSLNHPQAASAIEKACEKVLKSGLRTRDISRESSKVVGTKEMGAAVAGALSKS